MLEVAVVVAVELLVVELLTTEEDETWTDEELCEAKLDVDNEEEDELVAEEDELK